MNESLSQSNDNDETLSNSIRRLINKWILHVYYFDQNQRAYVLSLVLPLTLDILPSMYYVKI